MTWQPLPPGLEDDADLARHLVAVFRRIEAGSFAGDPGINRRLPIQVRAPREVDSFRVLLLLAPWMFSRLLFPTRPPAGIPEGWAAEERREAPYQVLGPLLDFQLLGQPQRAHLNYHPDLGHHLVQPLALNMRGYADAEAVYAAWDEVIRTRDENMEKRKRDCPWQREVSRREFFGRLRG